MTAIADAKTMIETGIGRVATTDELQRVAAAVLSAKERGIRIPSISSVAFTPVDPENPTNEEIAQLFIDVTLFFWKRLLESNAEAITRESNDAAVETAKAAALADLA